MEVGQLLTWWRKKSLDLPDKSMSEIQAKLEGLDSHAMQSLETPAINFTSISFCRVILAYATRKNHAPWSIEQRAL